MTGHHDRSNDEVHSPLKTVLRKLNNRYQSYCATKNPCYNHLPWRNRTHRQRQRTQFPCRGTGGIDIGSDNNNESTNNSDTTIAFGGSEPVGHDLLHSSQVNLTVLTIEINSSQQ